MVMHKFDIGDLAIVIGAPPEWTPDCGSPNYTGQIVTIIGNLVTLCNEVSGRTADVYPVDIKSAHIDTRICFEPHHLKPYYDGNEKSEWDESIFKPKELVRCLSD